MIVPSIDLMAGKAVQLVQGRKKVLERSDILALARRFGRVGEVAVIDLDAALGKGDNLDLVKRICKVCDCRVGGGLRSVERAREVLRAGASKVIIGTAAEPAFLRQLDPETVIVALDEKRGEVVTEGWVKGTGRSALERAKELEPHCSGFLYTVVHREGMMRGTDLEAVRRLRRATSRSLTAAGGITTADEIVSLDRMGVDAQVGMAVYTGKLRLDRAFSALIDFSKGLVPAVCQDRDGQVLMVGFCDAQAVRRTLRSGLATFYSRSRKSYWVKGETSGNRLRVVRTRLDCDRDTILWTVEPSGPTCHTGAYSCFGHRAFSSGSLLSRLAERLRASPDASYTAKLGSDPILLGRKLVEEAYEVATARAREELIWEAADLFYFLLVRMALDGVSMDDVLRELAGRRRGA